MVCESSVRLQESRKWGGFPELEPDSLTQSPPPPRNLVLPHIYTRPSLNWGTKWVLMLMISRANTKPEVS